MEISTSKFTRKGNGELFGLWVTPSLPAVFVHHISLKNIHLFLSCLHCSHTIMVGLNSWDRHCTGDPQSQNVCHLSLFRKSLPTLVLGDESFALHMVKSSLSINKQIVNEIRMSKKLISNPCSLLLSVHWLIGKKSTKRGTKIYPGKNRKFTTQQ